MRWLRNTGAEAAKLREDRPGEAELSKVELSQAELSKAGLGLERKYGIALALYGALAVVAWFTIGEGTVLVFGRQVEVRWFPVFILATFVFRTVMAMKAERIRRGK